MKHDTRPRVFVTRLIDRDVIGKLAEYARIEVWNRESAPSYRELARRVRDADAVLTMVTDRIDAALIEASPRLRVISNFAVGLDNIDVAAGTRAGIAVGHTPGVLTDATADLAFALAMAAARRVAQGDREVHAGRWRTWGPAVMLGHDVWGATLGIVGWVQIGRAMARRGLGFNMRVIYATRPAGDRKASELPNQPLDQATRVPLRQLLKLSDFVSLHVPLTPRTRHLIGAKELALMKPGAILINTARGAVIDQRALYRSLKSGHLGGAGLDVTDPEPIARADPLLKLPNVVITPHIGSASFSSRRRMAEMAAENIIAVLRGGLPRLCANPEVRIRPPA